jgi:hypothetical protein
VSPLQKTAGPRGSTENEEKGGNRRSRFIYQSALLFVGATFDLGFRGPDQWLFDTCGQKSASASEENGQSGGVRRVRFCVIALPPGGSRYNVAEVITRARGHQRSRKP